LPSGWRWSRRIRWRGSHFNDVPDPGSAMIGEPGAGFRIAMSVLDVFRSTVAAAALGFARRALDESLSRVRERELFGAPMSDLQMVQGHIADMALDVDASGAAGLPRGLAQGPGGAARQPRGGDGQALCHRNTPRR
jgi:alkylation response protein AidB-like acyl-CoA dehydrogenase